MALEISMSNFKVIIVPGDGPVPLDTKASTSRVTAKFMSRIYITNTRLKLLLSTHWGRDRMAAILQKTFWSEFCWMFKISLKSAFKIPNYDFTALFQIMAWRRPGDKSLSEPMTIRLPPHICVTLPQWVNAKLDSLSFTLISITPLVLKYPIDFSFTHLVRLQRAQFCWCSGLIRTFLGHYFRKWWARLAYWVAL